VLRGLMCFVNVVW